MSRSLRGGAAVSFGDACGEEVEGRRLFDQGFQFVEERLGAWSFRNKDDARAWCRTDPRRG